MSQTQAGRKSTIAHLAVHRIRGKVANDLKLLSVGSKGRFANLGADAGHKTVVEGGSLGDDADAKEKE